MEVIMKRWIVILICLFISGCAGLGDYSINLSGNYSLLRTSSHNITIAPKSQNGEGMWDENVIPAKVVEVGWNKDYIIAKQQAYPNEEYFYWILNVKDEYVEGPFILNDFQKKIKEYDITNLELKLVEDIQ